MGRKKKNRAEIRAKNKQTFREKRYVEKNRKEIEQKGWAFFMNPPVKELTKKLTKREQKTLNRKQKRKERKNKKLKQRYNQDDVSILTNQEKSSKAYGSIVRNIDSINVIERDWDAYEEQIRQAELRLRERERIFNLLQNEKPGEFNEIANKTQEVFDLLNSRIQNLKDNNLNPTSLQKLLYETGRDIETLFSPYDFKVVEDLKNFLSLAQVFLTDFTSTVEGAKIEYQDYKNLLTKDKFGRKWKTETNPHMYSPEIDPDQAKFSFKAYRMLEELYQSRIIEYDSHNAIALIFDLVESKGYYDENDFDSLQEIVNQAEDVISKKVGVQNQILKQAFEDENSIVYIINTINKR